MPRWRRGRRDLARLADAEAELGATAGRPRPLRIGSFPTAGASVLPPALRSLSRTHLDVEVRVEKLDLLEAMARVATHDLDLAPSTSTTTCRFRRTRASS